MTEKLLGIGLYVDTDELRRQARVLSAVADRLTSARQRFAAAPHLGDHASYRRRRPPCRSTGPGCATWSPTPTR